MSVILPSPFFKIEKMSTISAIGTNVCAVGSSGGSWNPSSPLGGETPNFWVKEDTRDGLVLPDTINPGAGDASILLPYLNKVVGNEYAILVDYDALNIGVNDYTIIGRFKSPNKTADSALFGKRVGGAGVGACWAYCNVTTGFLTYWVISSGTFGVYNTTVDVTTLGWFTLRIDINQATGKSRCFINNVQVGADNSFTGNFTIVSNTYFTVGCWTGGGQSNIGCHSDTYVFNRLLSAAECTAFENRGALTGAAAHWIFSEICYGGGGIFYDVSGNGNHLTAANVISTDRAYGVEGSRWMLDKGYSLYYNSTEGFYYLAHDENGDPIGGATLVYNNTFTKLSEHAGSLINHNLADSLITIPLWDRSDVAVYSNLARAVGTFYDAGNPTRWHPLELNQSDMDSWLMPDYQQINFIKAHTDSVVVRDYLEELISYDTVKTGSDLKKVLTYTNDYQYFYTELALTSTQTVVVSQVAITMNIITGKKVYIDWGDGNIVLVTGIGSNAVTTSTYAGAGTYTIKIYWDIKSVQVLAVSNATLSGNLTEFNKLTILYNLDIRQGSIVGNMDDITCPLTGLSIAYNNNIHGTTGGIPRTLTSLLFYGESIDSRGDLSGDIADLPVNLTALYLDFIIDGQVYGDADDLPASLITLNLANPCYSIDGNLANLSRMHQFCVNGLNGTWIGAITDCNDAGMFYFSFANMPNLTGNVEDMVASIKVLLLNGASNVIYNDGAVPAWVLSGSGIIINCSWLSAMVDAFLIAAASGLPVSAGTPPINLAQPSMGARTGASDAAVATLTTNHYVVTTN